MSYTPRSVCTITLLLLSCVTACRQETPPSNSDSIRVLWYGSDRETRILTAALDEYRKAHAQPEVELIVVPVNRHGEILSRMIAAGQAPDLARLSERELGTSPFREHTSDLSAAFTAHELRGFVPPRLEQCRIGSSLAGLPLTCHTLVTFYNRDAFRRAGVDVPATVHDTWTAEDFAATAKKTQTRGGMKYGWAAARDDDLLYAVDRMFGGPAGIAWFISQHIDGIAPRRTWMANGLPAASMFLRGRCGMLIDWSSHGGHFTDRIRSFSWDVTYLPRNKRPMAAITGDNWTVFSTNRIEDTIQFLRAITSANILNRWVESGDSLPVRNESSQFAEGALRPWQQAAIDQAGLVTESDVRDKKGNGHRPIPHAVEQAMANFTLTEP